MPLGLIGSLLPLRALLTAAWARLFVKTLAEQHS